MVNATGAFSDALRLIDEPEAEPIIAPSQGVHLVLDRSFLPTDSAIMVLDAGKGVQAQTRKLLVGSGDRSERIRTYNFPQGRVTDHRINLTLYKLDEVLEGSLDQVVQPLINEYQADQLAALAD